MMALNGTRSRLVGQTLKRSSGFEQNGSAFVTSGSIRIAGGRTLTATSSAWSASRSSCRVVRRCWPSMMVRSCICPVCL